MNSLPSFQNFQQLRRQLGPWYREHHRRLPWRETKDPYAIWVSESMLQQTQVATVIDYYHRFLARFPNVEALAGADEQSVLAMWQGLGYYRRARQMHAAARQIVSDFDGRFPGRFEDILSLPGVGRYTAGAIASFAYDARAPILEANTIRLFSRLMALREPTQTTAAQKKLWEFASAILPARRGSALVNQAAMELGSLVCTPKNPSCHVCPLANLCSSFHLGLVEAIPVAVPRATITLKTHVAVIIRHRQYVLMRQNSAGEWWENLWDFPRLDLSDSDWPDPLVAQQVDTDKNLAFVRRAVAEAFRLDCLPLRHVKTLKHAVTRFRIQLMCFEATMRGSSLAKLPGNWKWAAADSELPLSAPARRLKTWTFAGKQ